MSEYLSADFDKTGKGFILKTQTLAGVIYFMDEVEIENCPQELRGRSIVVESKKARARNERDLY